jgi:adenosylcobinamide-phosphate synthase
MSPQRGGQVATALLLDAALGEPPEAVHPIVLMGLVISSFEKKALRLKRPSSMRLAGIVLALSVPSLVFIFTRRILRLVPRNPGWVIGSALLCTTLSMRGLGEAAGEVERGLLEGRLDRSRRQVGRLVGRDTDELSESGVCRAAVESVAENTSDGVVAPMLYGVLFGAPGALAYKAVNTLDSMVGYRQPPYEDLGWASARLDDLANLAPSRLTVLCTAAVSGCPLRTLMRTLRYGPLTASPNAGMAEAAFAGALGVQLGGANSHGGVLRGGPIVGDGRLPTPEDIRRAVRLMRRCCVLAGILLFVAERVFRG